MQNAEPGTCVHTCVLRATVSAKTKTKTYNINIQDYKIQHTSTRYNIHVQQPYVCTRCTYIIHVCMSCMYVTCKR